MSKFTLEIETDNDAFGAALADEIARILREAANAIKDGRTSGRLIDCNGNAVGSYRTED